MRAAMFIRRFTPLVFVTLAMCALLCAGGGSALAVGRPAAKARVAAVKKAPDAKLPGRMIVQSNPNSLLVLNDTLVRTEHTVTVEGVLVYRDPIMPVTPYDPPMVFASIVIEVNCSKAEVRTLSTTLLGPDLTPSEDEPAGPIEWVAITPRSVWAQAMPILCDGIYPAKAKAPPGDLIKYRALYFPGSLGSAEAVAKSSAAQAARREAFFNNDRMTLVRQPVVRVGDTARAEVVTLFRRPQELAGRYYAFYVLDLEIDCSQPRVQVHHVMMATDKWATLADDADDEGWRSVKPGSLYEDARGALCEGRYLDNGEAAAAGPVALRDRMLAGAWAH